MTVFEVLSLTIELIGTIAIVVSIIYASIQIKLSRNIHKETLDWNRKTLTENELNNRYDKETREYLAKKFQRYVEVGISKIPLFEIQNAIVSDINVQLQIHSYLNKFERISRGNKNGLYDEELIIEAVKYVIVKVYFNYIEYIEHRRENANPSAWESFEALAKEFNRKYKIHCN